LEDLRIKIYNKKGVVMNIKLFSVIYACIISAAVAFAQFDENPFSVSVELQKSDSGTNIVKIDFKIPDGLFLYNKSLKISSINNALIDQSIPTPEQKKDPFSGDMVDVYKHNQQFVYSVAENAEFPLKVTVEYQGCSSSLCYMPQTEVFNISQSGKKTEDNAKADTPSPKSDLLDGFKIIGSDLGYKKTAEFIDFIDRVESGKGIEENPLRDMFAKHGAFVLIFFILLGGLALNLTPCVLPMIPINIAIIGAGSQAGSRSRGFMLGAVYGLGIAIVYGTLGLVVVLTGSQFGTLNSSPWFNIGIAILFTALALAMFDVFSIDFSKYQSGGAAKKSHGPFVTAFFFGGVAALLAGACIAPVLIWVLVFSTEIYQRGNTAGLLLPFILGIGMALPWPFAGAGLSFLPKPGKWMETIKKVFGVIILLAAVYYGWLGVKLLIPSSEPQNPAITAEAVWMTSLDEALEISRDTGKPIFIDVWATWCKSCKTMSATTLKNKTVLDRLDKYILLKFQAENPKDPATKKVLDAMGVKGQPFYLFLQPQKK
jgi:thiol:disulfide interchange protein